MEISTSEELALSIRKMDGALKVGIDGRLDFFTATDLEPRILTLIEPGLRTMVLDLSNTWNLDSSGVGVMYKICESCASVGAALRIENPQHHVKKILRISGFDMFASFVGGEDFSFDFSNLSFGPASI
jgi:anti-anti-sigma factor